MCLSQEARGSNPAAAGKDGRHWHLGVADLLGGKRTRPVSPLQHVDRSRFGCLLRPKRSAVRSLVTAHEAWSVTPKSEYTDRWMTAGLRMACYFYGAGGIFGRRRKTSN